MWAKGAGVREGLERGEDGEGRECSLGREEQDLERSSHDGALRKGRARLGHGGMPWLLWTVSAI